MGACRENFSLFKKHGRQNFFRRGLFGDKWARSNIFNDTFRFVLRFICNLFGHGKTSFMDWENSMTEELCHRCLRKTGYFKKYGEPENIYHLKDIK